MTRCAVCGREGNWQLHHLTGTDHQREYLDRGMTVPLCHDHHTLVHDDWKTLGIEEIDRALHPAEVAALRLRRCSAVLARIGSGMSPQAVVAVLLEPMARWADELVAEG